MKYTKNFKNWWNEMATENEGVRIINTSSWEELYELYTRCTGKSPFVKKRNDQTRTT